MSVVHFGRKSRPSALALRDALHEAAYNGPEINYGFGHSTSALNHPNALTLACNKRVALMTMKGHEVPIPMLYATDMHSFRTWPNKPFPLVGRPDKHSKGRGFWFCNNHDDMERAIAGTRTKAAATHFLQYIENAREFRVHVMRDTRLHNQNVNNLYRHDTPSPGCGICKYRSIKISEKLEVTSMTTNTTHTIMTDVLPRNHAQGNTVFMYQEVDEADRRKLRKAARGAVKALGLDFGAVDILLKDGQVYVLEVNTAPCLTDETSDTLSKYVECFMRYWSE